MKFKLDSKIGKQKNELSFRTAIRHLDTEEKRDHSGTVQTMFCFVPGRRLYDSAISIHINSLDYVPTRFNKGNRKQVLKPINHDHTYAASASRPQEDKKELDANEAELMEVDDTNRNGGSCAG